MSTKNTPAIPGTGNILTFNGFRKTFSQPMKIAKQVQSTARNFEFVSAIIQLRVRSLLWFLLVTLMFEFFTFYMKLDTHTNKHFDTLGAT